VLISAQILAKSIYTSVVVLVVVVIPVRIIYNLNELLEFAEVGSIKKK